MPARCELHSALLRTHFWDTPVEDNAALILGEAQSRTGPWAMLHVSWTEWKNLFSLEIYCRTAKIQVDGLVRSYGPQRLLIYRMSPELGSPRSRGDQILRTTMAPGPPSGSTSQLPSTPMTGGAMLGELADARYAWTQVEAAYAQGPYAEMREALAQ